MRSTRRSASLVYIGKNQAHFFGEDETTLPFFPFLHEVGKRDWRVDVIVKISDCFMLLKMVQQEVLKGNPKLRACIQRESIQFLTSNA